MLWGRRWFHGTYSDWDDAARHAGGYENPEILTRVLAAALAVKRGQAAYERDSVLFHEASSETELLANLQRIAAGNGQRLRVLDFGGSLGSTYWRHRPWLEALDEVRWDVVEQPHFAEAGRRHLQDDRLRFYASIDEAEKESAHDVLLASTVINYLPAPRTTVADFIQRDMPYLLFHNLALHEMGPDYVMVEQVPPDIYPASYPMWFFNKTRFLEQFRGRYSLEQTYQSTAIWDRGWFDYPSTGLLFKRLSVHAPC